ncbi:MAG TPA: phosphodiester glycosidase family protein, partial [Anaerolineae bacterium]|nr:phosphodiester glycosidase family protein [Anaerolineae bacterium]
RTLAPTDVPTRTPQPASLPTDTPAPTLIPTVSTSADGWQAARSGVQLREMYRDAAAITGRVFVVRIDPAQVDFHVQYQPDQPLHVTDWYSNSRALIVMNSSFFDGANRAVGQLVTDGVGGGQSHERMQGAFYLTAVGATVWPLQGWIKPAGLQVLEAVESFPMLLLPGGLLNPDIPDDTRTARRTVVAVDRSGRVLFIATPNGTFTLYGLAVWLANSDLDLDTALNFDGGSSSGLAVWTPAGVWGFDSANAVPAVIAVDTKVLGTIGSGGGEWP